MNRTSLFAAMLVGLLPLGCVAAPLDDEAESIREAPQAWEEEPDVLLISLNGLRPGLLANRDFVTAMDDLAAGPIAAPSSLANTSDGRLLLAFLARCALSPAQAFNAVDAAGKSYRIGGHVGLATGWLTGQLHAADRGWVSACLLAHANIYGIDVEIDLQGKHPALSGTPAP